MEPLRCLPFLRLSATVMFFFAVKFNHVIQVLLLVFLSAHQPPCAWQAVILGRHIAIVVQERQQKRKWEELIGWPGWLILDENSRCWPKVECEIVTQSTIRFVFHLPPFLLSLLLPLFAWRLRVYWIEFFDFHSLRTECNQTTAPSATLHQISSLKCFAKWLRSLLRKLFELFQKYEMSRPSQLGSVLCVSARAGKWEEWELEGTAERKSLLKVPLPSGSRMVHSEAPARSKPLRRSIERGAAGTLASNTEIRTF